MRPEEQPGADSPPADSRPEGRRGGRGRRLLFALAALCLAGSAAFYFLDKGTGFRVDNAFVTGHVVRMVSPGEGTVDDVKLVAHTKVRRGEVALVINRAEVELGIASASIELRSALRSELAQCLARRSLAYRSQIAGATRKRSRDKLDQTRRLAESSLVPDDELRENAFKERVAALDQEVAELDARRARYEEGLPAMTRKSIAGAVHALRAALVRKVRSTLRVPADAYVFDVFVRPGQRIVEDSPLAVLVVDDALRVQANVLESQLSLVRIGQEVEVAFDADPELGRLGGHVVSRVPAAAGVFSPVPRANADSTWVKVSQRVPVIIVIDDSVPVERRPPTGSSADVRFLDRSAATAAEPARADPGAPPAPRGGDEPDQLVMKELSEVVDGMVAAERIRAQHLLGRERTCVLELLSTQTGPDERTIDRGSPSPRVGKGAREGRRARAP